MAVVVAVVVFIFRREHLAMSGDSSWVDTLGGCYWHLVAPTGQDATKLPAMRQPPSKELPSPYVSSAEAANLGSGGDTE